MISVFIASVQLPPSCTLTRNNTTFHWITSIDIGASANLEVALQRAEMRMVRWMCGMKLQGRIPSKGLRERLGLDYIISVLQQNNLRWYGHVLRKEDKPRQLGERLWKNTVRSLD